MGQEYKPVAIVQAKSYNSLLVQQAVENLMKSLHLQDTLAPKIKGKSITIKPNLLMKRKPEEVTTTHPEVMKAIILWLQKYEPGSITIADSPGGPYNRAQLTAIYRATGMEKVAKETGVLLNYETGWKTVATKNNSGHISKFNLIDPVHNADFVVSVGKLKTHCMTGLSGGVKNLFGCIPGLQKPELHFRYQKKEDFCRMLVELAQTVKPCLTIIDAVESMEGDGPSGGTKKCTGFICAGESPFTVDRFFCHLTGFKIQELPTVAESIRRGLCPRDFKELKIENPQSLPLVIPDFKKPKSKSVDFTSELPKLLQKPLAYLQKNYLSPKPVIKKERCIGCGKCAESCPAKTIKIIKGKAMINYDKCIKCFCCHEMCPVKAIDMRKAGIFR